MPIRIFQNIPLTRVMKITESTCVICGKKGLSKNEIGINKKLRGDKTSDYFCVDCLAENLGCEVQDILDKIEEFKNEGCKLFE